MRRSSIVRMAAGLLLVGAVAVSLIWRNDVARAAQQLLELVRSSGPWGPFGLGAGYVLAVILFVPGSLLTIGAGFVFGVVVGTITVSIASMLGAAAAFLLGRSLARNWIERIVARHATLQAIDTAIRQNVWKIVRLLRLSPLTPFNLLNYALGLTKVSFLQYVLASWLGMLPGTVTYTYLGSTFKSLAELAAGKAEGSPAARLLFWAGLLATVAVTIVVPQVARNALREAVPVGKEANEA